METCRLMIRSTLSSKFNLLLHLSAIKAAYLRNDFFQITHRGALGIGGMTAHPTRHRDNASNHMQRGSVQPDGLARGMEPDSAG